MLGNDIVDVGFWEAPNHQHIRYLDRVCTPEEAGAVRRSANPVKALAAIWAAKEAAYKLFSKRLALCHFVPRQFVTQIENRDPVRIDQKLSVLYERMHVDISIIARDKWVHAVTSVPATKIHWVVREIEDCFPGNRGTGSESEAARFLANDLLDELGVEYVSLQFDRRVPKLMLKGGGHSGMDVSLSHHGAFAAAAVAWPACHPPSLLPNDAGFTLTKYSEAVCSTCTA